LVCNSYYSLAFDQFLPAPDAEAYTYQNWKTTRIALLAANEKATALMNVLAEIHLNWGAVKLPLCYQDQGPKDLARILDAYIEEVCPAIEALMLISCDYSAMHSWSLSKMLQVWLGLECVSSPWG
jgi:hypothetical protein